MSQKKIKSSDYLLILLYLDNKKSIKSSIRLVKMMFLFTKEIVNDIKENVNKEMLPQFIAYNFGPFSQDIYEQVELFKSLEFISVASKTPDEMIATFDNIEESEFSDNLYDDGEFEINPLHIMYEYKLENNGVRYVEQRILPYLDQKTIDLLTVFKKKINSSTVKQILYYVYNKYPEYIEKSLIKWEVLEYGKNDL